MRCLAVLVLTQIFGTDGFFGRDGDRFTIGIDGSVRFADQNVLHAVNKDGSAKWTFDANALISAYEEGSDGTIHVVTQSGSFEVPGKTTLYALNGSDGSKQWQHLLNTPHYYENLAVTDSTIYLLRTRETVTATVVVEAFDAAGALKWAKSFNSSGTALTLIGGANGGVLLGDLHSLRALSSEDGRTRWEHATTNKMDMHHVVSKDGSIFVTQSTTPGAPPPKREFALDLLRLSGEDGSMLWNVSGRYSPSFAVTAPIVGCNGEVYVGGMTNKEGVCNLHAFDFDGNFLRALPVCHQKTRVLTDQNADGTEEDIIFDTLEGGSEHRTFLAYSGANGRLLWNSTYSIPNHTPFDTVFGPDGKLFPFFVVEDGTAIAIRNREETWTEHVEGFALIMAEDGTTYNLYNTVTPNVTDSRRILVALDMSGMQKWSYKAEIPLLV